MIRKSIETQRQLFDAQWHGGESKSYPPPLYCDARGVWEGDDVLRRLTHDAPPTYPTKQKEQTT